MRSLTVRLSAGLVLSLIVVFILQWVVITLAIRETAESYVLTRLQHDLDALLAGLVVDDTGRIGLDTGRLGPIYQKPFSGHYYRIRSGNDIWRSRSLWDRELPEIDAPSGASEQRQIEGPQAQPLLVLTHGVTVRGQHVILSIAEDLAPLEMDLKRFNNRYALVTLAALVLLLMIQGVSVHLGLRPLMRLRSDLTRLERGEIGNLDETAPREIQPLVRELNRLLTAVRERLQRSRRALGNLAHALKTPLTLLTDLASMQKIRTDPQIHRLLIKQTNLINQLIERELKRARLAGESVAGQRFDLQAELSSLIDTLRAIHRDRNLSIEHHLIDDNKVFMADREDMLELLGNLLDNACKWGRSRVRLTVDPGTPLRLRVEDDGPGCTPDELVRLTARGARLDETAPGYGLGLAIVRDIVESYHGRLEFGRSSELGGLSVRVELPIEPFAPV